MFELLCEKLTKAIITFLRLQIRAGVDAVQIFDSLGGILPKNEFCEASAVWMREIVAALAREVPVIVFSKGTRDWRIDRRDWRGCGERGLRDNPHRSSARSWLRRSRCKGISIRLSW